VIGKGRNQMRNRTWLWPIAALIAVVPTASQAADNRVEIDDHDGYAGRWRFNPDDLTVSKGSTVVWPNTSGTYYHTVKANDGAFDSKHIDPGHEWSFKFSKAGDFAYYCEPHPWMKGVIHVK
jgi:plastocyanin